MKEDSDEELEYVDSSSGVVDCLFGLSLEMEFKGFEFGFDGVGYIWEVCEGVYDEEWKYFVVLIFEDKFVEII